MSNLKLTFPLLFGFILMLCVQCPQSPNKDTVQSSSTSHSNNIFKNVGVQKIVQNNSPIDNAKDKFDEMWNKMTLTSIDPSEKTNILKNLNVPIYIYLKKEISRETKNVVSTHEYKSYKKGHIYTKRVKYINDVIVEETETIDGNKQVLVKGPSPKPANNMARDVQPERTDFKKPVQANVAINKQNKQKELSDRISDERNIAYSHAKPVNVITEEKTKNTRPGNIATGFYDRNIIKGREPVNLNLQKKNPIFDESIGNLRPKKVDKEIIVKLAAPENKPVKNQPIKEPLDTPLQTNNKSLTDNIINNKNSPVDTKNAIPNNIQTGLGLLKIPPQKPEIIKALYNKQTIIDVLNQKGQKLHPAVQKPVLVKNKLEQQKTPQKLNTKPLVNIGGAIVVKQIEPVNTLPKDKEWVSIKIKWELSIVKQYCIRNNRPKLYSLIKKLLEKATSVIRMYVKIPANEPDTVLVREGSWCPGYKILKDSTYRAHLVMLTRIYDANEKESSTIAKSIYCQTDVNHRSTVGRIAFNFYKFFQEGESETKMADYLLTIVHETLHTLAFHSTSDKLLVQQQISDDLKHLAVIKKVKQEIYDEGHWLEAYLPNDLMTPVSRSGSIVTIFTLELIEQRSKSYSGNRDNLPYNIFFDQISSESDFFKYECSDLDETPKYPFFCTLKQFQKSHSGCSLDYTFVTGCSSLRLNNKCFPHVSRTEHNCLDTIIEDQDDFTEYEHRGQDSRCFASDSDGRSMCLKYSIKGNQVHVHLGKSPPVICTENNKPMQAKYMIDDSSYYDVKFLCPNIDSFIKYEKKTKCPANCNNNGFCANGECICFDGYDNKTNCASLTNVSSLDLIFTENTNVFVGEIASGTL